MADEDDEDALFDRLAKSLGAIRQDAELARSAGAQATLESVARAEAELHRLAAGTDALRNQVEQQRAVTMRLEAAAAKSDADIQDLRRTVEGLLHREWAQAEAAARPSARRPRRRAGVLIGMALVLLILGGGAVAWNASDREPTFRALAHRVVAQLSELTGIDLAALVSQAQIAPTAVPATPTPAPVTQPPLAPAPTASAEPVPAVTPPAAGVVSAKTPAIAPSPPAHAVAAAAPPPAATPVAAAPPPTQTAGAIPPSPATPAPAAALPPDQSEIAAPAPLSQSRQAVHRLMLQATGTTWVKVRQKGGDVLLRRTMKAGETWPVPDDPNLILDTGNAVGLELMVDGVPTKLPVTKGGIIHNLPLDADLLGAGAVRPAR